MQLSCIVAMAHNRVIGVNNQLPWHLPADLKHFKALTISKPILMGRKTFESIGRPLPGRKNIVLTRDQDWKVEGVTVVNSVDAAMTTAKAEKADEIMLIGGAEVYRLLMPSVDKLYITEVDLKIEGDAFFPEMNETEWHETSRQQFPAEDDKPAYAFVEHVRV